MALLIPEVSDFYRLSGASFFFHHNSFFSIDFSLLSSPGYSLSSPGATPDRKKKSIFHKQIDVFQYFAYKPLCNPINRPWDLSRSIELEEIYILVDLELHRAYLRPIHAQGTQGGPPWTHGPLWTHGPYGPWALWTLGPLDLGAQGTQGGPMGPWAHGCGKGKFHFARGCRMFLIFWIRHRFWRFQTWYF